MPKRIVEKVRGVFERVPDSGIWWIHYQVDGKRHRERVGNKSDAIDLYYTRKADAIAGRKLPQLRNTKSVTLSDLIDDVLEYVADHKDNRNYVSKAAIVREALGNLTAADITPQEIDRWLRSHCKTAATSNRYKAFISLCYREGLSNGKVTVNPARLVRRRKESVGRLRFLSKAEYASLSKITAQRFPSHLAEFIVSCHSGMRLGEQYTVEWSQVDLDHRVIDLTKTKNGSRRTVQLNADSVAAIVSVKPAKPSPDDRVFVRDGESFDNRSWFQPCLEEAKITGYVWHSNRHTFCSWLAMAGASIKEIQELAGHKSITMAARYAHLSPAHKLNVIDRIASPVKGKSNSHQNSHQAKTASRKK